MNTIYEPIDHGIVTKIRESFSARLLTDPQFEEFASICGILHREIHRSGSFIEKLETYAFAVSRAEKGINAAKADTILRDIFKGLFGQSLDQLRKQLLKTQEELDEEQVSVGLDFAYATLQQIEDSAQEAKSADGSARPGTKAVPFYRAYAEQAALMATELGITDVFAKKLISEQFEAAEAREFYEEGKQFEDKFYRPQIEAEKRNRESRNGNGRRRYGGFASGQSDAGNAELAESMGIAPAGSKKKSDAAAQPAPANG